MTINRTLSSFLSEQSANASFDGGTLFIDAVNGRVGIGNTAPGSALTVVGTLSSTGTASIGGAVANYTLNVKGAGSIGDSSVYAHFTTLDTGTTNTDGGVVGLGVGSAPVMYITNYENAAMAFSTNASEKMRITSGGNVGIGVTAPISKLSVATASDTTNLGATGLTIGGATTLTSGNVLMLNFTPIGADSNRARAGIGCEVGADWGKGNLTFYTKDTSGAGAMTTSDERMRIDSNGYVGIGTTSPLQKVQIVAPSSSGNISPALAFSQGGSGSGTGTSLWLGYGAENTKSVAISGFYDGSGMTMAFYTTPTAASTAFSERMRIDRSGNLLVGTTSSTSGYVLKVGGANANILIQADSPNGATLLCDSSAAGSKGAFFGHITTVSQAQVRCGASGGVYLSDGATSWAAISDERQKTDLVPITDALVKVSSLRAVTGRYVWDEKRRAFLIAQEVQQVLPEAVDVADDADGTLGLAYTDVIPLLVASIKELSAKVAALEAK